MVSPPDLHRFLLQEFDAELLSGFSRLRRVPDTRTKAFVGYLCTRDSAEQRLLAEAVTSRSVWGFHRGVENRPTLHSTEAQAAWDRWDKCRYACIGIDPLEAFSVPMLRLMRNMPQSPMGREEQIIALKRQVEYARSIKSVKAPELRKRVRTALGELSAANPKQTGGDWEYSGKLGNVSITVYIDYGGSYAQLNYEVNVEAACSRIALHRMTFENLFDAGNCFGWDFIIEENIDDAMTLLRELVGYLAEFPRRLDEFVAGTQSTKSK